MHDLVHDLAQSVMEDECLTMEVGRTSHILKQRNRHITLAINSSPLFVVPESLYEVESLRTFLAQRKQYFVYDGALPEFCNFLKFGSLRVFDASYCTIAKLASSVGNLKHIRYLNLSWTSISTLPESICHLWNLQTLNLNNCWKLQKLPELLRCLKNLRHLCLEGCEQIRCMPPKIGQLTCLKTLSFFIVGNHKGCLLSELQGLNLRGRLCIKDLDRVGNVKDAKEANLIGKQNLRCLDLSWGHNNGSELQENVQLLLEALEPHPNLQELVIQGYKGTQFPVWLRDSVLKNIVRIGLYDCKNCSQLPSFGQLLSLRELTIIGMKDVEYIDNNFPTVRGFPSLKVLYVSELSNLKALSRQEEREAFPLLKELTLNRCNSGGLSSISNLNSLTSLHLADNEELISFPEEMLRNLTVLQSLKLERYTKLKELPTNLANLTALKSLDIIDCHELESLPEQGLQGLNSLQHVRIDRCNNLKSLSEELRHLTALQTLSVSGCPELVTLPEGIKHLISLRHISLSGCFNSRSKLVALPEALRDVPALQSLEIRGFPELTSLPEWLGDLTSLHLLEIWNCPKVASIPTSVQSLTNLQTLVIVYCPELARRCEKGRGEDWCKIEHVQVVATTFEEFAEAKSIVPATTGWVSGSGTYPILFS